MAQIYVPNLAIWKINKHNHAQPIKCEPNFLTFKNNKAVTNVLFMSFGQRIECRNWC